MSAVEQLDELRRLRVRRAEAQLAGWQARCQQAAAELQCAQARVSEALVLLASNDAAAVVPVLDALTLPLAAR